MFNNTADYPIDSNFEGASYAYNETFTVHPDVKEFTYYYPFVVYSD